MEDCDEGKLDRSHSQHDPGACRQTNVLSALGVSVALNSSARGGRELALRCTRDQAMAAMLFAINTDQRSETFLSGIRTDNAKAVLQKRSETARSHDATCNCCARERLFSVQRFSAIAVSHTFAE